MSIVQYFSLIFMPTICNSYVYSFIPAIIIRATPFRADPDAALSTDKNITNNYALIHKNQS